MQISAINLIIAAQQARHTQLPRATVAGNTTSPTKESATPKEFVPLTFASGATNADQSPVSQSPPAPNVPPGSQIDIRI